MNLLEKHFLLIIHSEEFSTIFLIFLSCQFFSILRWFFFFLGGEASLLSLDQGALETKLLKNKIYYLKYSYTFLEDIEKHSMSSWSVVPCLTPPLKQNGHARFYNITLDFCAIISCLILKYITKKMLKKIENVHI